SESNARGAFCEDRAPSNPQADNVINSTFVCLRGLDSDQTTGAGQALEPFLRLRRIFSAISDQDECANQMANLCGSDRFYGTIPVFRAFASLMDPALYAPLPDDWSIGVADIVESTKAIAQARYKAVNMAGASVIAAVTNALEGRGFPFVFGGDGASFAVSPDDLERAREALAATAIWVEESLILSMRVALVPVRAVRAQGLDVRVARFGPSPNLSYAMFSGGGLGWAEAAM